MSGPPSELRYANFSSRPPLPQTEPPPVPEGVEVGQLWTALRTNRRFIVMVALLVGAVVMAVTFASRVSFQAKGRLYLGETETGGKTAAGAELVLAASQESKVSSEMEILRSESLVTRAIRKVGLNASIRRSGQWSTRFLPWLLSGRDPKLVDGIFDEIGITDASMAEKTSREARTYTVRFVGGNEYEVNAKDRLLGRGKLGEALRTAEMTWTLTPGLKESPRDGAEYEIALEPLDRVLETTMKNLEVIAPKGAAGGELVNVVSLQFRDTSPQRSAAFLRALMEGYLSERQAWKTEDASAAEAFVGEQLAGVKRTLDEIQEKLADFRTKNEVVVLGKEGDAMIDQLGNYEERRLSARLEVAALADVKRRLSGANPPAGAFLMGEANDTVLQNMADTLSQERAKLADLQTRFSDVAPDVREQRARVEAQLTNIRGYVETRLARAQQNLASLSGLITQLNDKLKSVPGAEFGLAQLSREAEVFSKTYSYLLERQQQAAIFKASTLSKNRVLDAPEPPVREDSPKLPLRLASLLAGLLLGAVIVVVRRIASDQFHSESDVQRETAGVPIFGVIPPDGVPKPRRKHTYFGGAAVVQAFLDDPGSRFVEAVRTIRASLRRWTPSSGGHVFLVTSPGPGDGRTTVALALASVLAAEGKHVLLIDADQGQAPEVDTGPTLGSVLSGDCLWEACVRRLSLPYAELSLILAGRPVYPEGCAHERRERLLIELRQAFDFIVVDAAAFPPKSDVLSWAELADGVVSVFRLAHTSRKRVVEHLKHLSHFARSLAVVVNDAGPVARARVDLHELPSQIEATSEPRVVGESGPQLEVQDLLTVLPGGHPASTPPRRTTDAGRKTSTSG